MILIFLISILLVLLSYFYWKNKRQKRHSLLRNYPLLGYLRYWIEQLGPYLRHYLYLNDREEMPFNRATRSWVYRLAKNEKTHISFGSSYDIEKRNSYSFYHSLFPYNPTCYEDKEQLFVIGTGYCQKPFYPQSFFNISGMSFGALSAAAVRALSWGAKISSAWLSTGEGGLSQYHLEGSPDIIFQIGTAKYGVRDEKGCLSIPKLQEISEHECVKAFELKLSQGAKPGKGGLLTGCKVTEEIAHVRGIPVGEDSVSPNRHDDIHSTADLIEKIILIRRVTGKPVGLKLCIGSISEFESMIQEMVSGGLQCLPDFISVDGAEGGSGSAPQGFFDHVGVSIKFALPQVVDILKYYGVRQRVAVIASGKLITSSAVAWALAMGANFVISARGPMFALGCIQSLKCHTNECPTGVTTHNPYLQKALIVEDKKERVAHYILGICSEVKEIAHACGVVYPSQLSRNHVYETATVQLFEQAESNCYKPMTLHERPKKDALQRSSTH